MKIRYVVAISVLILLAGLFLRAANAGSSRRQVNHILELDQAGLSTDGEQRALSDYVHGHMHASIKFELTGSYNRAAQGAAEAATPSSNGQIYQQAQAACQAMRADAVTLSRCVTNYVQSHTAPNPNPQPAQTPDHKPFARSYHAPPWTPDTAGLVLLAGLSGLVMGLWLYILRSPKI